MCGISNLFNNNNNNNKNNNNIEGMENIIGAFVEGKVSLAFDRSFGGQTTFILCEILEEHSIQHEEHMNVVRF